MTRPIVYIAFLLTAITQCSFARTLNTSSPFVFIENKGQIVDQNNKQRKDIDFKLDAGGMNVFIGKGQIHYQWNQNLKNSKNERITEDVESPLKGVPIAIGIGVETYRLDVTLVGANTKAEILTEEKAGYYENYYLRQCPDGARAYGYQKIIYKNIYPHIDWVLYVNHNSHPDSYREENQQSLKYDFIVHPGGNVNDIQLRYDGATAISLINGALTATTPFGTITEEAPHSYEAATKKEIGSAFVLTNNILSFHVNAYDGTLIIDPVLNWVTGASTAGGTGHAVVADKYLNSYKGGYTSTLGGIATSGAHQQTLAGAIYDACLFKYSPSGAKIWGTYYGDTSKDYGNALAIDTAGYIYFAGGTGPGTVMATTGAHQPTHGSPIAGIGAGTPNSLDGFLAKFDSGGTRIWGTFYGGRLLEEVTVAQCDDSGNVFIAGYTFSDSNMSTPGSFLTVRGTSNSFFAKFSSSGVRRWGTYFGDTTDRINAIVCDDSGNVYIGGRAAVYAGIATIGSHQPANGGGTMPTYKEDGYLVKFSGNGTRLWGTYYGGYNYDEVNALALDGRGNIFIAGSTASFNNIGTTNGYSPVFNSHPSYKEIQTTGGPVCIPSGDSFAIGFMAKLTTSGTRLWGSYYRVDTGNATTNFISLSPMPDGSVYATGLKIGYSPYYRCYSFGWHTRTFIIRFNNDGWPKWTINFNDSPYWSMCTYRNGKLFLGLTPTGGPSYVYQYQADTVAYIVLPFTDTLQCPGKTFQVKYKVTNRFTASNMFRLQLSDTSGSFSNPLTIGTLSSDTDGIITGVIPANVILGTRYRIRITSSAPADTSPDNNVNIRISPYPIPNATADSLVCEGSDIHLYDFSTSPATGYMWTGPGGFSAPFQNYIRMHVPLNAGGDYVIAITNHGCTSYDTVTVIVQANPDTLKLTTNSPVCFGDTLWVTAVSATPGVTYNWLIPQGYFQSYPGTWGFSNAAFTDSGKYKVQAILNGCPSELDSISVSVNPVVIPSVSIVASPGVSVSPMTQVTFTANIVNGGAGPVYQWMKNGIDITGATNKTYQAMSGIDLFHGDVISVRATSNEICPKPPTVYDSVEMEVGIRSFTQSRYAIYPNPTTGEIVINFSSPLPPPKGDMRIELRNLLGQIVLKQDLSLMSYPLRLNISIVPAGTYMLQLQSPDGYRMNVKVVKE
jgi:hypothetical protein